MRIEQKEVEESLSKAVIELKDIKKKWENAKPEDIDELKDSGRKMFKIIDGRIFEQKKLNKCL